MSRIKSTGKTAGGTPKQARGSRFVAGMIAGLLVLGAPAAALADTLADALAGAYNNSGGRCPVGAAPDQRLVGGCDL